MKVAPGRWQDVPLSSWMMAARPRTLAAGAVPVLVGAAVASTHEARLWLLVPCLICSLLIQVGTNLFNDYYDFARGADGADRLGPVRVTQAGLIPARVVVAAAVACFVVAAACGAVVVGASWPGAGPALLAIGVACLLCGWLYTGGPWPLAYLGLGEVFVFVFFGLVATAGTALAVGGVFHVDALVDALVSGAAVGALASCLIVVNNLRDVVSDARARKRTLAVRFGPGFARLLYAGGVVVAVGCVLVLAVGHRAPSLLLPLLTLPLAVTFARRVWRSDGAALNPLLGSTGLLLTLFGLLLSVGWVLS